MSKELRQHGCTSRFCMSDSRAVVRILLGGDSDRAGYNSRNTYRVRGIGPIDQVPSLLKADGAGSMTPMRSKQWGVRPMTTSGLGHVYLE